MIIEIRKDEIPDWDYGDIAIKTYSFGDQNKIGAMAGQIRGTVDNPDIQISDTIQFDALSNYSLMAGIHYIKTKDNILFVIKPGTMTDEKLKYAFEISKISGNYLTKRVAEINKNINEDEKKNLLG